MNTNEIMSSLAEYMRLADETAAIIGRCTNLFILF